MPTIVSVVSFNDSERQVLGGAEKDRAGNAKKIGAQIKKVVDDAFKSARELTSTHPTADLLQASLTQLDGLDSVLGALPQSDEVATLRQEAGEVRSIIRDALGALPV
jgi:K+-transporting ATPase c subunit